MLFTPIVDHAVSRSCNGSVVVLRNFSSGAITKREYLKCYHILKIPEDSSLEEVRSAFISLAKKFHPDGGSPDASATKFQEVENAYRTLQDKYTEEKELGNCDGGEDKRGGVEEYDIQHTAPQHRQYLSFDGYGAGTPSQRQKQHQKIRAVRATDNVISHRIQKLRVNSENTYEQALAIKDKVEAKKIKTRYGMDRLVEDLIQESMAKGDFDNLSGRGKPLKHSNTNPYVDFVTHKLNEVLIENGFTPEWITLQKEIREDKENLRHLLQEKRISIGPCPLSKEEESLWQDIQEKLNPIAKQINVKINKYNLLVPMMHKQMLQVQLNHEADKILKGGKSKLDVPQVKNTGSSGYESGPSIFDLFSSFFGSK